MKSVFLFVVMNVVFGVFSFAQNTEQNNIPDVGVERVDNDSIVVTVYVSFIVNKKGNIKRVKVIKSECNSCYGNILNAYEKEAVRVVKNTPKFTGSAKKHKFILPIKFVLPVDSLNQDDN